MDGPYLAVLGAAVLCYAALGAVLRALPWFVGARLHGGPVAIGLAVGAPSLTGALFRPVGGRLADRHGPMPVMLSGAALMAVAVAPAFIPNLGDLVVSRLIVGCGEALIKSSFPREHTIRAVTRFVLQRQRFHGTEHTTGNAPG